MKKCLSALLATLLLLTMLPLGAVSVSALVEGMYTFLLNDDEASVTITDVNENIAGQVVIPSTLRGYPVTAIGEGAFWSCDNITAVEVPVGVVDIGKSAFIYCDNLISVFLPKGLLVVGEDAFMACGELQNINIPNTVKTIGECAFFDCYDLKSIVIPNSVTSVGSMAFAGCSSLTEITIPGNIETVSSGLFCYCAHLKSVVVEKGITSIASTAFSECSRLTDITIPNSVTSIEQYAFSECTSLIKITVPGSVKSIGFRAFSGCKSLTNITLEMGIASIASHTFMDCTSLKEVAIPTTVTVIENDLFKNCQSLTDISFGKNITEIKSQAFEYCYSLSDVWFAGTKEDRGRINYSYGTDEIQGAIWHYNCYPFEIVTQPKTTYAKEGAKISVKVEATGEGLKYQWYIKNDGASKYSKSSVTSATYSTTMNDKAHGRRVRCIVTDKNGNELQSDTALLRRQASITKQPATTTYAKKGAKVSVKITAKGDGLKYTWYIKNDGQTKYSKSSIASSTYSTTMSSKVKNRRVYCVVKDKYGKSVQSKIFILRESVSITAQPKTVTVAKNKTAKVTVKASGDGLKYTWYIKNAGSSKYSKSSVKTASYSVKMTSKVKNRLVYCVVTDKYGKTVKTVTVKLKMK